MSKPSNKWHKHFRKTVTFRFHAENIAFDEREMLLRMMKMFGDNIRIIGPYVDDSYHVWEPRPGKHGRPSLTRLQKSVQQNRNLFEVIA